MRKVDPAVLIGAASEMGREAWDWFKDLDIQTQTMLFVSCSIVVTLIVAMLV